MMVYILVWIVFVFAKYYERRMPVWHIEYLLLLGAIVGFDRLSRSRPSIRRWFIGGLCLLCIWIPIALMLSFKDLCVAILLLANWAAIGYWVMRWIRPEETGPLDYSVFGLSMGMVIYSYIILGLGLEACLTARNLEFLSLALIIPTAFSIRPLWNTNKLKPAWIQTLQRLKEKLGNFSGFDFALALGMVLLGCLFLAGNFSPPTADDDVAYHYAGAKIFAEHHSVFFIPYLAHFNFPFSAEMLYTAAWVLGGRYRAIGWINVIFLVLLLGAFILGYHRYRKGMSGALCAFAMFFSINYAICHGFQGTSDIKYLLYSLLMLVALIRGLSSQSMRWLLVSALVTGCSLGFRYHGLILLAFGALAFAWKAWQEKRASWLGMGAGWSLVVLVVGCPFLIKNWVYTGNPVFPSAMRWFNGFYGDSDLSELWRLYFNPGTPFLWGVFGLGMGWKRFFLAPWDLTVAGGLFGGTDSSPIFLAFAPLVLWRCKESKLLRASVFFAIFYMVAWFFQWHQTRMLYPVIAVWTIGIAYSWWSVKDTLPRAWVRPVVGAFLLLPLFDGIFRLDMVMSPQLFVKRIPVVCGLQSEQAYLESTMPNFNLTEYANAHLPENAVVVSPWEPKLFYLNRSYILADPFLQVLIDYRRFENPENFLARLKELGVTHILIAHKPEENVSPFMGPPGAALILLSRELKPDYFEKVYSRGPLILARIKYPADLKPYDAKERRDPMQIADFLMDHGSIDFAQREYALAESQGNPAAAARLQQIVQMSPLERGDYYFKYSQELKDRNLLPAAYQEYQKALNIAKPGSEEWRTALARMNNVKAYGMRIAPHIWRNS